LEAEIQEMITTDSGMVSDTVLDYRRGYPKIQSIVGFNWTLYERRQKDLEQDGKMATQSLTLTPD